MRLQQRREVFADPLWVRRLRCAQGLCPEQGEREGHRGRNKRLREPIQPAAEKHELPLLHQGWHQLFQEACRVGQVISEQGVLTGILSPSVLFIPATGSTI